MALNRLQIQAVLVQREQMRYSPAGVPVLSAILAHESEQSEAGVLRKVELELQAVFAGKLAREASALDPGVRLKLSGFITARRRHSKTLALHVTEFEFLEV
ncbi:MAG: primosomal replication protein N [Quisquiliibacterium sp.]